ncbi:MAG: hypothetical protein AAFN74_16125 [Myxococcota bacterium]
MDDALVDILEKVQEALDADGVEADAIEALLYEDPEAFAGKYSEYLTEQDRKLLGAVSAR